MSKNNCCCKHSESNSSGFVFGVIIGAVIGAIVAIIIYKRNQGEVFDILKQRLNEFVSKVKDNFSTTTSQTSNTRKTKNTDVPIIESIPFAQSDIPSTSKIKKPRTFVRPKK